MGTWICSNCKEVNEDNRDQCWKCGTHADGAPPPRGYQADDSRSWTQAPRLIDCPRCPGMQMEFIGRKRFHESTQTMPFLLGDIGELFGNREKFDLHACPSCGKVELFLSNRLR